ncbi:MAG TPA: DUF2889 domain-containing protein [Syntrophales bacterium]|nr:DUF2889 domain-containing protein [Syntrophales bacterium]
MGLLEQRTGEKVHSRTLEILTYPAGDRGILVTGELVEKRLRPYYGVSGEIRSPHTVHHMIIRMLIEGLTFAITEIEVEMPGVPRDACLETAQCLNRLVGMNIAAGFTLKAREAVGGRRGCTHLLALLTAMAPAAVQGFWVHHAAQPMENDTSSRLMEQYLIDSCWVWRREGPMAQDLLREIADEPPSDRSGVQPGDPSNPPKT